MAAMWAVLTRLEIPNKANLTLLQKLKALTTGKTLAGLHRRLREGLQKKLAPRAMDGISPRYIRTRFSTTRSSTSSLRGCVNRSWS